MAATGTSWGGRVAQHLVLALMLLAVADFGQAQERNPKPDLRLLIDISGSMKQSDPENLRAPALDLIVRLLPEGAKAGVWIFGETVEPLVEHRVIDEQWRRDARTAVASIDNSGQRTNIPAALAAATYDLEKLDPNFRTSVVLLTDGKVDVAQSPLANARAARKLLSTTGPNLGATGVPVYTIALSDEADWGFLRSLAETTTGLAEKAESAAELTEIFVQSLEMVAPTARIPMAGSSFQIDKSVNEFTALVVFEDAATAVGLVSPGGKRYRPQQAVPGVDWFRSKQFALVTVSSPEPGSWQLNAPANARTRVTVLSDLQLEVDPLPNSLPADRVTELGVRLRDGGQLITDPELLKLFVITVQILAPDGSSQELEVSGKYPPPANGEYRVTIPAFTMGGRYQVVARVTGKTLQRELPMYVEVIAGPANPSINTRPDELPEANFITPIVTVVVVLTLLALLAMWNVRRRRRNRLALWQRRFQDEPAPEVAVTAVAGMRAEDDDLRSEDEDTRAAS